MPSQCWVAHTATYKGFADGGYYVQQSEAGASVLLCADVPISTVSFEKLYELELKVEVEGEGYAVCAGYIAAESIAKRGYAPGEEVKLYATALPGYKFIGWRGDGKAWVQEDEPGGPYAGNPDPLGQIEDDTIFLRMGEGYEPPQVRNVTAVFEKFAKPTVHGFFIPESESTGGEYGAAVRLVFENAAGWYVEEKVDWGDPEGAGFSDCATRGEIFQPEGFIVMKRCDIDGTPNPNGAHAFIDDRVRNLNGPPWFVTDRLQLRGESLPCASTTVQFISLAPSAGCTSGLGLEFTFEQRVMVDIDGSDIDNGTVSVYHEVAGSISFPWTRLW